MKTELSVYDVKLPISYVIHYRIAVEEARS